MKPRFEERAGAGRKKLSCGPGETSWKPRVAPPRPLQPPRRLPPRAARSRRRRVTSWGFARALETSLVRPGTKKYSAALPTPRSTTTSATPPAAAPTVLRDAGGPPGLWVGFGGMGIDSRQAAGGGGPAPTPCFVPRLLPVGDHKVNPRCSGDVSDVHDVRCGAWSARHSAIHDSDIAATACRYRPIVYKNAHKKSRRKLFAYNGL